MLGDHFKKPLEGALLRKFRAEIMNIPDDMEMGNMGTNGIGSKRRITCKQHNKTYHGSPQDFVGGCGKVGGGNGAVECPYGGTHKYTYNAIIF